MNTSIIVKYFKTMKVQKFVKKCDNIPEALTFINNYNGHLNKKRFYLEKVRDIKSPFKKLVKRTTQNQDGQLKTHS